MPPLTDTVNSMITPLTDFEKGVRDLSKKKISAEIVHASSLLHNTSTIGLCLRNMTNMISDEEYYRV